MEKPATIRTLKNKAAFLSVDLNGGAIRDFQLEANAVNPLSFAFSSRDMPLNNRNGAAYQGHFLCLGRWGEPSEGERKAGVPNHGQAANLLWTEVPEKDDPAKDTREAHGPAKAAPEKVNKKLEMEVDCPMEGLLLRRSLQLDQRNAAFAVEETVHNTAPLGRLYNMVQHPALAAPFLDDQIVISCNATAGFNQFEYESPETDPLQWPFGRYKALGISKIDLRTPSQPCTSVFSFTANPKDEYGWITAWSPTCRLLLGYAWKRRNYPWIHLWQDWEKGKLRYLGIEFGTAALHQPFPQLLETGLKLFGEKTTAYIDAGENHCRRYLGFICETAAPPERTCGLEVLEGGGRIKLRQGKKETIIETDFKDFI